jgi:hypothetical protein
MSAAPTAAAPATAAAAVGAGGCTAVDVVIEAAAGARLLAILGGHDRVALAVCLLPKPEPNAKQLRLPWAACACAPTHPALKLTLARHTVEQWPTASSFACGVFVTLFQLRPESLQFKIPRRNESWFKGIQQQRQQGQSRPAPRLPQRRCHWRQHSQSWRRGRQQPLPPPLPPALGALGVCARGGAGLTLPSSCSAASPAAGSGAPPAATPSRRFPPTGGAYSPCMCPTRASAASCPSSSSPARWPCLPCPAALAVPCSVCRALQRRGGAVGGVKWQRKVVLPLLQLSVVQALLPHGQQVMRHCCLCPAGAGLAGDVAKLGALGAAQVPHATGRGGREGCIQAGYAAAGSGVSGAGNGGWRRRGTTSAGHCIGWHLAKGGVPPSQPPQLALQPAGQAAPALCTPARPPDGAPACGLELHNGAPPPSSLHRCSARAGKGRATGSWPTGALAAGESSAGEAVGQ